MDTELDIMLINHLMGRHLLEIIIISQTENMNRVKVGDPMVVVAGIDVEAQDIVEVDNEVVANMVAEAMTNVENGQVVTKTITDDISHIVVI
jgi:hypothetical protein